MPFPAAKLFSVALRQLSKPMAAYLQTRAEKNPYFKLACISMATSYHKLEQKIINKFYDKEEKELFVAKLNEAKAVKLGATVIGEAFIFAVAAVALITEYRRSALKEAAKEKQLQTRIMTLEAQMVQLQEENDKILKSVFPHENHIRSSVDVDYQIEGFVSKLFRLISPSGETEEQQNEDKNK